MKLTPDDTSLTKEIYTDLLKPTVQGFGKTISFIPQVINAALSPLEIWILTKNNNVDIIKKLLAIKLESVNPDDIVVPEAYVAVPAIQTVSYCMDNDTLRELYVNLIAKSMIKDTKESVHPSFVNIIAQLSPLDALVFQEFTPGVPVPTTTLSIHLVSNSTIRSSINRAKEEEYSPILMNFQIANASEDQITASIENLQRLGLIHSYDKQLSDSTLYAFVTETPLYLELQKKIKESTEERKHISINKNSTGLTTFGNTFREICVAGI